MSLEIKGKVTQILEPQTGTSAKGDWKKETFVIIEDKEQYPKSIAIDAFNKDFTIKVGDVVNVSINLESREYNGKYFTNVNAWKVDVISSVQPGTPPAHSEPIPEVSEPLETDDLPF